MAASASRVGGARGVAGCRGRCRNSRSVLCAERQRRYAAADLGTSRGGGRRRVGNNDAAAPSVKATVFRCASGHVLVCTVGANLVCGQANASRTPGRGQIDWCREHPNDAFIPLAAAGHDTIYAWRCQDGAPQIDRQTLGKSAWLHLAELAAIALITVRAVHRQSAWPHRVEVRSAVETAPDRR